MFKTFRKGGIHPAEEKLTAGKPIVRMEIPEELVIPLAQCIGKPSVAIVKPGDSVMEGQLIAEAGGFVGAPLHSPVTGIVKKIESVRNTSGLWQQAIIINKKEETDYESLFKTLTREEVENLTSKEIIEIVGNSGIVGLGGATFPTRVKLSVPEGKKAEFILINGAECEPYLTCDDALMRAEPQKIIEGALLLKKAVNATKVIIGIEVNKKEALRIMTEESGNFENVEVVGLKKKYPQGSEKQLIYALTGRIVPAGGLPIETGCIVDNVATAFSVYDAVFNSRPLTERIITVSGKNFPEGGNFIVKNGTSLSFILEKLGGIPENTGKIIAGGPMMGRAVSCLEAPATKGLSGIVLMDKGESFRKDSQPCIRCAACISVCPIGLEPYLFMQQYEVGEIDGMNAHGVMNCLECGCCSYSCPANRPLLDMIRLGKQQIRMKK